MKKNIISSVFVGLLFTFSSVINGQEIKQEVKSDEQLIKELIEKKRAYNKMYGFGYRIQLYNGFETEAKKIQAKFKIEYPEISTFLRYRKPEWIIQVGSFKTKLDADRTLLMIEKKFPSSIVIPVGK